VVEVNEYFDGKVKSLGFQSASGTKTVGVMEPGEYEFDVTVGETMTVIDGTLSVYFPEDDDWDEFEAGASFDVAAGSKLKVKTDVATAYVCEYEQ
jgi:purine/pyrimidine-nucleoside phosphorylase